MTSDISDIVRRFNKETGYASSFGIFQDYYTTLESLDASPGAVATVGACQQGIIYLLMPIVYLVLTRYPYLRRYCGPLGLVISFVSLTGSAFVDTIGALIATQGVLYAIGCSLLFSPINIYMDEWFVQKKGMAHGIMWAGKASVGVMAPFIFSEMLSRVGHRVTILSWAACSALLMLPTMFFMKPRVPVARTASARRISYAFLKSLAFWMMFSGVVVQALGYMMPSTYLASYARTIGLSSITAPILIAFFHMASVPGSVTMGMLGDKFNASMVILTASFGGVLPVFLLWGLSFHFANLVVFVLLYGFFAGSFSSTWSSMVNEISRDDNGHDSSVIFGMLLGGRGVGYVLAGPISGALLSFPELSEEARGYATKYGPMIIFTGVTGILGAWSPIWKGASRTMKRMKLHCMSD